MLGVTLIWKSNHPTQMSTGILLEGVLRGIFLKFKFKRLIWFPYAVHDNDVEVDSNAKQMSQVLQKYTHFSWDTTVSYNMFMYFWSELRTAWKDTSTYGPYINKNTHPAHLHIVNVDKSAQKNVFVWVLAGIWHGQVFDLCYGTDCKDAS